MTLRHALPLAALALAACSGGTTMEAHMKSMGELITATQGDLDAHKTAVAAATDVAAIVALEGPHATKMSGHLDAMGGAVEHMKECTKDGKAPNTAMMSDSIPKMKSEDEAHHTTMAGVADLVAARAEEDRHHKAMTAEIDMMMMDQTSLTSAAASYICEDDMHM